MKRLCLFISVVAALTVTATAANADSALVEHTSLAQTTSLEAFRNPALRGLGYRTDYSQLALGIDLRRASEAFVPEKGTGHTLPYLRVNTYHHLNSRSGVWGEASYTTGKHYAISWNSTSDFDLLQPYVLADTVGGDTRRERYTVSGGYALGIGRWAVGTEVLVRAEQEYRTRDPRMRGVVTDLTLRLGARFDAAGYRLGATIGGNIYKQTNSVDFYREEGVVPEYQMTGLGTQYNRFTGDKRNLYYDGGGLAIMLHASPKDRNGVYTDITLLRNRYRRKLADFNSMPLTDLYNEHAEATIGWERRAAWRIAAFAHFDYSRRTGNEHIGGTSDARYFPVIACLTMYKAHYLDAYAGILAGRDSRHVTLTAGYTSRSGEYVYPQRQMEASHIYARLQGQCFLRAWRKVQFTLNAQASYHARVGDKIVMPFANMDAPATQLIEHKYAYARANYTAVGAGVRADGPWKGSRLGIFGEVGGNALFCSTGGREAAMHAAIGITF